MPRNVSPDSALTIVILTLNEVKRLPACVGAVPENYPIVVLDSGSTDGTRDLARSLGCHVVENPWTGFFAQRNFAIDKCGITSKWILFVDADEIYEPAFFAWFEKEAKVQAEFDVGQIASLLLFKSIPLKHSPGYPMYHPRLIRRGHAHFVLNHTGHGETVNSEARVRFIEIPYLHDWFDGNLIEWLVKHVRLASLEARLAVPKDGQLTGRAKINLFLRRAYIRIPARFFYHYVLRLGFLDGRHGLEFSLMYAWFEGTKGLINFMSRTEADNQ